MNRKMHIVLRYALVCSTLVLGGCVANTSEPADSELLGTAEQSVEERGQVACTLRTLNDQRTEMLESAGTNTKITIRPLHDRVLVKRVDEEEASGLNGSYIGASPNATLPLLALLFIVRTDEGDRTVAEIQSPARGDSASAQNFGFDLDGSLMGITPDEFVLAVTQNRVSVLFAYLNTFVKRQLVAEGKCDTALPP